MPPEPTNEPERREPEEDSGGDNQMRVAGMIVGTALIFIGFLDIFLSISGGFEIDVIPLDLLWWGRGMGECRRPKHDPPLQPHRRRPPARSRLLPLWGSPLLAQASHILGYSGCRHVFYVQRTKETRITAHRSSSAPT